MLIGVFYKNWEEWTRHNSNRLVIDVITKDTHYIEHRQSCQCDRARHNAFFRANNLCGVIERSLFKIHYMRDHGCCLTPILQGRRGFLEMWCLDFLVIRVCYVSRSKTLKSWILKKSNDWVLSTVINYTHPARAEITGILQGIESFVVKYWYWVKSEASIPKRLGILCALMCLVSS